jgi:hypothetical protein
MDRYAAAIAHRGAGQNRQHLAVEESVIRDMRARRKAHAADVAREADGDLRRAHVGDGFGCRRDPAARGIVRLGKPRAFDQNDDGRAVAERLLALAPGGQWNLADARLHRVEKIRGTLDVDAAALQVVRHRCLLGSVRSVDEPRKYVAVMRRGRGEFAVTLGATGFRPPPASDFAPGRCRVCRQALHRERAEVERPVLGSRVEQHRFTPVSALCGRLSCRLHTAFEAELE